MIKETHLPREMLIRIIESNDANPVPLCEPADGRTVAYWGGDFSGGETVAFASNETPLSARIATERLNHPIPQTGRSRMIEATKVLPRFASEPGETIYILPGGPGLRATVYFSQE